MFSIGDLVIYSTHGVCKITDISEKTIAGVTREYYDMHTVGIEHQMTISTPVHDNEVTMLELIGKDEANDVLKAFKNPMMEEYDNVSKRQNAFAKLVDSGDRGKIADVINTLMRKQKEAEQNDKKLTESDRNLLNTARDSLFEELAISLNTSSKQINETVAEMIQEDVS